MAAFAAVAATRVFSQTPSPQACARGDDARLARDFKVSPKYAIRLPGTVTNLSNHFNPVNVSANIAEPQNGIFFGNYHRMYRGDFDVVF